MYHVSAQGVDERMINVHYYYYYYYTQDGETKGRRRTPQPAVLTIQLSLTTAKTVTHYSPSH